MRLNCEDGRAGLTGMAGLGTFVGDQQLERHMERLTRPIPKEATRLSDELYTNPGYKSTWGDVQFNAATDGLGRPWVIAEFNEEPEYVRQVSDGVYHYMYGKCWDVIQAAPVLVIDAPTYDLEVRRAKERDYYVAVRMAMLLPSNKRPHRFEEGLGF